MTLFLFNVWKWMLFLPPFCREPMALLFQTSIRPLRGIWVVFHCLPTIDNFNYCQNESCIKQFATCILSCSIPFPFLMFQISYGAMNFLPRKVEKYLRNYNLVDKEICPLLYWSKFNFFKKLNEEIIFYKFLNIDVDGLLLTKPKRN